MAAFAAPLRFLFLILVWFWLATLVLQRMCDVRAAAVCWVFSVAVSGAAALAQLFLGNVVPTPPSTGADDGDRPARQRPGRLGRGRASRCGRPCAGARAAAAATARSGAALLVAALVLSGSFGSVLAAVAGLAVAAVAARGKAAFAAATAVAVAVAAVVSWLQVPSFRRRSSDRFDTVTSSSGTFAARVDVFEMAWSRSPTSLVGVGFGFDPRLPAAPHRPDPQCLSRRGIRAGCSPSSAWA